MILEFGKKIFNRLFYEETKNIIRNKCAKMFLYIDQTIVYKGYLKALKYVLKARIYKYAGNDYGYRYDNFLAKMRMEYIREVITHSKFPVRDEEMARCIKYVKENGPDVYCGSLDGISVYSEKDIGYDEKNNLFYGMYEGKKLYLSGIFQTAEDALGYLNGIAAEQSEHSPHRYLTPEFNVQETDVIFDVGCAEGNFALSVVDRVKEVYLFEVEEIWIKPLTLTFAPYGDKVHIIKKCMAKKSDEFAVSIDDFCKENQIEKIGLLKMDVEGYEKDVLLGAKKMIKKKKIDKMAICVYHKIDDEKTLGKLLPEYHKTMAEGYMLLAVAYYNIFDIKPPYFTKGVMRTALKEGKNAS